MAFNDRKDVMEAQSTHLSIPQAHNITQHQSIRTVSLLTTDVEGLQLTKKVNGMEQVRMSVKVLIIFLN